MSNHNQNNQRLRRNGSPSMKQGPIRATQQFAFPSPSRSLVRSSPTSSPVAKENKSRTRPLSETGILSGNNGRRSPSSPCGFRIVEKPKPINASRSSSFDNGMAAPYLSGQWPKDGHWQQKDSNVPCLSIGVFAADKQTQTPEEWDESNDRRRATSSKIKSRSQSVGSGDQQLKTIKHKLQRNGGFPTPSSAYQQRLSPVLPTNNCLPATASTLPIKIPIATSSSNGLFVPPRGTPGKTRGSVEGLNQEVEKLIISGRKLDASECLVNDNLDGHRAPVYELLSQTRSVDTQTPSQVTGDYSLEALTVMLEETKDGVQICRASDDSPFSSSRDEDDEEHSSRSVSPSFIPGQFELEDSGPLEQNDDIENLPAKAPPSPRPNSEFMRQPPDGAEKIKIIDELASVPKATGFTHHLIPSKTFQPSATSAFQCLPPMYRRNVDSPLSIVEDAH